MRRIVAICLFLLLLSAPWAATGKIASAATDKTNVVLLPQENKLYQQGETFHVYIQAENVVDLFGLQFTLNYDPALLQIVDSGIQIASPFTSFGGTSFDPTLGVASYPLINSSPTTTMIASMRVADITFRTMAAGTATVSLTNIKAVNREVQQIQASTQFSLPLQTNGGAKLGRFKVTLQRAAGLTSNVALGNVPLIAVQAGGQTVTGVTSTDGTAVFNNLPLGDWTIKPAAGSTPAATLIPASRATVAATGQPLSLTEANWNTRQDVLLQVMPLKTSGSTNRFDIADTVWFAPRLLANQWDINQDGAADAGDLIFLLNQIKSI